MLRNPIKNSVDRSYAGCSKYALAALGLLSACQPAATKPGPETPAASEQAEPQAPTTQTPDLSARDDETALDLSQMDPATAPGEDFFRYANGRWLDTYELKPDEMRFGAFIAVRYKAEDQVKALIDELVASEPAPGTAAQKVADYFNSYMDVQKLDALGIAPLTGELKEIAAIKNRRQLIAAFGKSNLHEAASPIGAGISIDRKDPDRYILSISQAGLGLPDRSYYLEDSFAEIRTQYVQHIATVLGIAGWSDDQAQADAAAVVALETAMAGHHWPREELRDADKTYNIHTLKELEKKFPGYTWKPWLKAQGIDVEQLKQVNVTTPSAITPLAKLVESTPLPTWRAYLSYHLVKNHAPLLGDTIDDTIFAFYGKVLGGQEVQRDRWKRGVNLVGDLEGLGDALGKLYVQRYFPESSKAQMDQLVENLRAAYKQRIESLSWMGEETRKAALEKLGTFNPKVGYPKTFRDFAEIEIVPGDLIANYRAVRQYWYDDTLSRLSKPTDRDEWFMTPQTVNAYYNPMFNEIVFPAAILQPPFFDPEADAAINYGAIGAVIGHEMGHGFDDQGSKFDAQGVQRNWWTDEDRKRFEALADKVIAQYGEFEVLPGHKLNGKLTVGENIGDLGGLSVAYHAYRLSLQGEDAPVIAGLTGDQRFFLSWAQVWRSKWRQQYTMMALKRDPHSPGRFRTNGVVRNIGAWYDAFDVKEDDALYLPPAERVTIW